MSPKLKAALDYGPLIVFLAVFLLYRDQDVVLWGQTYPGLILATLVFVPLTVLANAVLWKKTGELSVMQLVTLVVVVVFGGLTIWLNDPRFIKMKPTLIYLTFAALLALGAMLGRNWLGRALGEAIPLSPEGWRILTHRIIWFCLGLAALNEVIWRTQSDTTWVVFKTVGLIVLTMLFFVGNAPLFNRHALQAQDNGDSPR
ncbi:inner membrane-spanning protein YciB [Paracoccus salipaludis]|uniref:Inner membrane-spanning protein YciB n=1 Tax=Paracoccus salipaludis TaxID=2032623 RepID=A0A2A2GMF4_9RHOB|nr:septation protein IspZ [Paracoccus salipaludis]PAU98518.1 intracellular septation protein A [Paracoccus salipaludis]